MPFTSPFGSIMSPSFNPSYSNVPQNKPPKPAAIPENKPPKAESTPEMPESSVAELNAGITPHVFAPKEAEAPEPPQFNAMPMTPPTPPVPMEMPQPFQMAPQFIPSTMPNMPSFVVIPVFMPQSSTPQEGVAEQATEVPQLPQRLNPNRPIFV